MIPHQGNDRLNWPGFLARHSNTCSGVKLVRGIGGASPNVTLRRIEAAKRRGETDEDGYAVRLSAFRELQERYNSRAHYVDVSDPADFQPVTDGLWKRREHIEPVDVMEREAAQ
jgi:hypothetical protein